MKKNKKRSSKYLIFLIFILLIPGYIYFNPFLNLKLNGNSEIKVTLNSEYNELGVTANFFGKSIKNIQILSNVNSEKSGTYFVKYSVNKYLSYKVITRKVIVLDNVSPKITFTSTGALACPNNYNTNNYSAFDNIDGDITANVKITKDGDYLIYSVKDSSGNLTSEKRKVTIADNEKPNIILKGNKSMLLKINTDYVEYGYTVFDNCDGDITANVKLSGSVNINVLGDNKITYMVKDSSGNSSSVIRTISVVDEVSDISYPLVDGYSTDIVGPTYIKGILIVNKTYTLPSDYDPGVNKVALDAFMKLQADAKKDGYTINIISGYRSYSTQKNIYERNLNTQGSEATNLVSARPGHSEHQTGLSFDVGKIDNSYGTTESGKWLAANCNKYGFIIRYPLNKTDITQYSYEPWHIRYLGVSVATEIFNRGITLEEYLEI